MSAALDAKARDALLGWGEARRAAGVAGRNASTTHEWMGVRAIARAADEVAAVADAMVNAHALVDGLAPPQPRTFLVTTITEPFPVFYGHVGHPSESRRETAKGPFLAAGSRRYDDPSHRAFVEWRAEHLRAAGFTVAVTEEPTRPDASAASDLLSRAHALVRELEVPAWALVPPAPGDPEWVVRFHHGVELVAPDLETVLEMTIEWLLARRPS